MKELLRKLSKEKLTRTFAVDSKKIDADARTIEIALSSEEPYGRWFGIEILGHEKNEIDMEFLASGRAPFLAGHNHNDQVGVIEKAWVDPDRRIRAKVRFGKSDRAAEFFDDVVDGIRQNISVGYQVKDMKLVEKSEENGDTYRVTSWRPFEGSLVSVPADTSVGVGRSDEIKPIEETKMEEKKKEEVVDIEGIKATASADEKHRVREIMAIGTAHGFDTEKAIADDQSVDQFRGYVLDELKKRGMKPVTDPNPNVGLDESEVKSYSFLKVLHAMANPTDRKAQEAAAFEFDAGRAAADKMKKTPQGVMVPMEILKRDLNVGTATAGGHTVSTDLLAQSFIDLLRNRMSVNRMGATTLSGLVGDIAIPRQTGGATAYWVAESGSPTESQQAFDQVTMAPNTVGAFTDISRKLLLQSSIDIENFVRTDLATVLALAIDVAAINGSGASNQPTGILNTTGIGDVAGGTDGLAPAWSHIIDLWTEIAQDNADFGRLGYLTNSKVIGTLMQTEKASGTAQFIAAGLPGADGMTSIGGSRCGLSNQVPSNLTKGTSSNCSAIIYGNWADLLVGLWGSLDLMVDPYTGSTSGTVRVVALQDVDVVVRHAESFAAMQDALTA